MTPESETIPLLQTGPMAGTRPLEPRFEVHHLADGARLDPVLAGRIRGVIGSGGRAISADLIAELPKLEIVANFGVGYDSVDVAEASARGVVVTNTPDVLTEEVADFTLGLMIATVRRLPAADAFVRRGDWPSGKFPLAGSLRGRKVGLLGMGRIGAAIARRCAAMGLEVSYHSRSPKADAPYPYHASVVDLARAVDVMIVIVPGGASTRRIVDTAVLQALGPQGVLINVARGSVVDEPALIAALQSGQIMAAGLDVFEDEPHVPEALRRLENVVLCPHLGTATAVTRDAMGDLVLDNIRAWFGTGRALTPVNQGPVN